MGPRRATSRGTQKKTGRWAATTADCYDRAALGDMTAAHEPPLCFSMNSREYVVGLGPWRSCWAYGLDAMTLATYLEVQLTTFWRHQSKAPIVSEG